MTINNQNAKTELLEDLTNLAKIRCAIIAKICDVIPYSSLKETDYRKRFSKTIELKENYSEEDLSNFLNDLDFEYDSGYGQQELYGIIWLTDGSWLSREEYDGSEWWQHWFLPSVPLYLQKS